MHALLVTIRSAPKPSSAAAIVIGMQENTMAWGIRGSSLAPNLIALWLSIATTNCEVIWEVAIRFRRSHRWFGNEVLFGFQDFGEF
jgi:hypothetical protein